VWHHVQRGSRRQSVHRVNCEWVAQEARCCLGCQLGCNHGRVPTPGGKVRPTLEHSQCFAPFAYRSCLAVLLRCALRLGLGAKFISHSQAGMLNASERKFQTKLKNEAARTATKRPTSKGQPTKRRLPDDEDDELDGRYTVMRKAEPMSRGFAQSNGKRAKPSKGT
jgi:hypothetical protein